MGFMGLSHWTESDGAADFQARIKKNITKLFNEELKNEANEYNTPGWINILFMLKSYPNFIHFMNADQIGTISALIKLNDKYLKIRGGKALVSNYVYLVSLKAKELE